MADSGSHRSIPRTGTPKLLGLAIFVAAAFMAGWVGSIASNAGSAAWYAALLKPGFTPSDAAFAVVWSGLYLMIGIGAWLVWTAPGSVARNGTLLAYFVQLALSAAWAWAFFGVRSTGLGLLAMLALFLATSAMIVASVAVNRSASVLFLPYLIWVGFLTAWSATLFLLN